MFRGDVLVLELADHLLGFAQHAHQLARRAALDVALGAACRGQPLLGGRRDRSRVGAELLEHGDHDPVALAGERQQQMERAIAEGDDAMKPTPLVITIEEAHRFLNPEVAGRTIFGTIAREMRKYNVTLLVIDQRPSGIDEEVMSQMGTKITCLLDNERDVDSVLAGVSGRSALKSVLARLAPKQQALVFGHAVPMPVAFQPREYGSAESYRYFTTGKTEKVKQVEQDIEELW